MKKLYYFIFILFIAMLCTILYFIFKPKTCNAACYTDQTCINQKCVPRIKNVNCCDTSTFDCTQTLQSECKYKVVDNCEKECVIHSLGPKINVVQKASDNNHMFGKTDHPSEYTLDLLASSSVDGGKFSIETKNFITTNFNENKLVEFIYTTANNVDWSPDVQDIISKLKNDNEIYMTQQQVAYILANLLLGNNTKVTNSVIPGRNVGGKKIFYSDNTISCNGRYQLCVYFTAMNFWMNTTDLENIIVCYAKLNGDNNGPPVSISQSNKISVDYNGINTLSDYDSDIIRLIDGSNTPGGSYMDDITKGCSAQEESAFCLYPELAVGMFILPSIETVDQTNGIKSWIVIGTRRYNVVIVNSSKVTGVSTPKENNVFYNISNNLKICPSAIVSLSSNLCNSGGICNSCTNKPCNKSECGLCWNCRSNDLNILFNRASAIFNIENWPTTLKELNNFFNISNKWTFLGGRWGSGAWGCNPTFSITVQALSACSYNWKKLSICKGTEESSLTCVCTSSGEWDYVRYTNQLSALKQIEFDDAVKIGEWNCI